LKKQNEVELEKIRLGDVIVIFPDIMSELSHNIFVSEHRLRYQSEQQSRNNAALKKFYNNSYMLRNRTLEEFVKDYNSFLWLEIDKSHMFQSPKIEANYRRNYHDGEVSPVTSIIFYLYFKTDKVKRFMAQLLLSAYRNPYTGKSSKLF
jgi:hypothetical protein